MHEKPFDDNQEYAAQDDRLHDNQPATNDAPGIRPFRRGKVHRRHGEPKLDKTKIAATTFLVSCFFTVYIMGGLNAALCVVGILVMVAALAELLC